MTEYPHRCGGGVHTGHVGCGGDCDVCFPWIDPKAPAPAGTETCPKCHQAWSVHVGDGHDNPTCPDAREEDCGHGFRRSAECPKCGNAPAGTEMRITGRDVHREWRDIMLAQRRHVPADRMKWEKLSDLDRDLDDRIAVALMRQLAPAPAGGSERMSDEEFDACGPTIENEKVWREGYRARESEAALREALRKIADSPTGDDEMLDIWEIARAALKEER